MPPAKPSRFPRAARLLRHADFERVYKQGRRHFSACMTVFYLVRTESAQHEGVKNLRVGFTVGRALGGAVQRNRTKRRLREAVRLSGVERNLPVDVVINPKKTLLTIDFVNLRNEIDRAFAVIEGKLTAKTQTTTTSRSGKTEA
jgi:ribonuclease P protein component